MKLNLCWLYAISKYGYPPSIENTFRVIEEAANLGFHYMEMEGVREKNMREVYQHKKAIKDACEARGIKIMNFCPILPELVSLDANERRKGFELYELGLEIASFLGAELVQIDSFTPPLKFHGCQPYKESIDYGLDLKCEIDPIFDWNEQWEVLVETFTKAAELAKEAGLKLCVEPRVGEMISNTDSALRLLDHVRSENLGVVLDTGHQHAQKEILPLSVEKLKDKIFYLHVADNDGKVNEHRALGEGNVDWEGVFQALKKHGFNGYVGIDVGKVPNLENAILKSKAYLVDLCSRLGIELEV